VNLAVAEAEMQAGRLDRAVTHFQRAIYGVWPPGVQPDRARARLELVDALDKQGKRQQAAGELISLTADMPDDAALLRKAAQRLSALGVHDKAAEVYRLRVKRDPKDVETLGALGEEELTLGNLDAACTAFRGAGIAARVALCDQMEAIDPMLPGVSAAERYRRSQALLAAVQKELQNCSLAVPASALPQTRRPSSYSDASEANLAQASKVWAKRIATCAAAPAPDTALTRVMSMMKH
jgi:tetratricopeptide (TPR) repeat protein